MDHPQQKIDPHPKQKALVKPPLTEQEKLDWLRLSRSETIGPITFFQLLNKFQTADVALRELPRLAKNGGLRHSIVVESTDNVLTEMEKTYKSKAYFSFYGDETYPSLLKNIPDAPPVLICRGSLRPKPHTIGIVGARNASLNGKHLAQNIAEDLGQYHFIILSGLARGIDTAAHTGGLSTGTIAVIAGGIDTVYPPENKKLYEQIAEAGLIISETPYGVRPSSPLFPRRNRIIAGMSQALVIIEAATKSGSLITANHALDYNRDVFIVPGSPLDPRYHGSNRLIRDGGRLIQSAEDILDDLEKTIERVSDYEKIDIPEALPEDPITSNTEKAKEKILENLSYSPITIDELIQECQLSPSVTLTIILELELAGKISRTPQNHVSLKADGV